MQFFQHKALEIGQKKIKVVFWLLFFGLGFRLSLPFILKIFINHQIDQSPGIEGRVEGVDLDLYRGAYQLVDLKLRRADPRFSPKNLDQNSKKDLKKESKNVDFFDFRVQRLSVEIDWDQLWRKVLLVSIRLEKPNLVYSRSEPLIEDSSTEKEGKKAAESKDPMNDWLGVGNILIPLKVGRIAIEEGRARLVDHFSQPSLDLTAEQVQVKVKEFIIQKETLNEASIELAGSARVEGGYLDFGITYSPFSKKPVFDIDAELLNLNLTRLNPFFESYYNFDLEQGQLSVFFEMAARDGNFKGYIKPITRRVDVVNWKKDARKRSLWGLFKESLIGVAAELTENDPKDQLATQIPFEGSFEKDIARAGVWPAFWTFLSNGFQRALAYRIDQTITPQEVPRKVPSSRRPQPKKPIQQEVLQKQHEAKGDAEGS